MTELEYSQYLKEHIHKFGASEKNKELIEYLLVLGISSFKSLTEGIINPKKSLKMLKKATGRIVKDYFELRSQAGEFEDFQSNLESFSSRFSQSQKSKKTRKQAQNQPKRKKKRKPKVRVPKETVSDQEEPRLPVEDPIVESRADLEQFQQQNPIMRSEPIRNYVEPQDMEPAGVLKRGSRYIANGFSSDLADESAFNRRNYSSTALDSTQMNKVFNRFGRNRQPQGGARDTKRSSSAWLSGRHYPNQHPNTDATFESGIFKNDSITGKITAMRPPRISKKQIIPRPGAQVTHSRDFQHNPHHGDNRHHFHHHNKSISTIKSRGYTEANTTHNVTPNRPRASSVDPRRKFENFDTFSPSVVNTNGYEDYGGRRGGGGGGGRGGGGGGGGGGNQHILVGHQNQRLDTSPSRDGVDSAEKMQAKPARKAWKYEYDIDDFQIHGGKKNKRIAQKEDPEDQERPAPFRKKLTFKKREPQDQKPQQSQPSNRRPSRSRRPSSSHAKQSKGQLNESRMPRAPASETSNSKSNKNPSHRRRNSYSASQSSQSYSKATPSKNAPYRRNRTPNTRPQRPNSAKANNFKMKKYDNVKSKIGAQARRDRMKYIEEKKNLRTRDPGIEILVKEPRGPIHQSGENLPQDDLSRTISDDEGHRGTQVSALPVRQAARGPQNFSKRSYSEVVDYLTEDDNEREMHLNFPRTAQNRPLGQPQADHSGTTELIFSNTTVLDKLHSQNDRGNQRQKTGLNDINEGYSEYEDPSVSYGLKKSRSERIKIDAGPLDRDSDPAPSERSRRRQERIKEFEELQLDYKSVPMRQQGAGNFYTDTEAITKKKRSGVLGKGAGYIKYTYTDDEHYASSKRLAQADQKSGDKLKSRFGQELGLEPSFDKMGDNSLYSRPEMLRRQYLSAGEQLDTSMNNKYDRFKKNNYITKIEENHMISLKSGNMDDISAHQDSSLHQSRVYRKGLKPHYRNPLRSSQEGHTETEGLRGTDTSALIMQNKLLMSESNSERESVISRVEDPQVGEGHMGRSGIADIASNLLKSDILARFYPEKSNRAPSNPRGTADEGGALNFDTGELGEFLMPESANVQKFEDIKGMATVAQKRRRGEMNDAGAEFEVSATINKRLGDGGEGKERDGSLNQGFGRSLKARRDLYKAGMGRGELGSDASFVVGDGLQGREGQGMGLEEPRQRFIHSRGVDRGSSGERGGGVGRGGAGQRPGEDEFDFMERKNQLDQQYSEYLNYGSERSSSQFSEFHPNDEMKKFFQQEFLMNKAGNRTSNFSNDGTSTFDPVDSSDAEALGPGRELRRDLGLMDRRRNVAFKKDIESIGSSKLTYGANSFKFDKRLGSFNITSSMNEKFSRDPGSQQS